jgi:hypothetical protein
MLSFRHGDRLVFALTYGPRAQWVQNVLATGECVFEMRSGTTRLVEPRLLHDPDCRLVPAKVGSILGRLKAYDFLEMRILSETAHSAVPSRRRV